MKLLILSRYDFMGASSRLRTLQYIPTLEDYGFNVTYLPLFDSKYLENIYQSKSWLKGRIRSTSSVILSIIRRLNTIIKANCFDVIWLEKEIFPYLPGIFEGLLAQTGIPYIIDYDDAIFHRYDQSKNFIVKTVLSKKLDSLIAGAFAITAGNQYLANYAKLHGARQVEIIPTTVNLCRYHVKPSTDYNEFRIGWIGSPSSSPYLQIISKPLQNFAKEKAIRLVTVGAPKIELHGVPIEQHKWTLENEVNLISTFDVGVMPLLDSPWERGKCAYKLIQYMACGRAVIASPIGMNSDIVMNDAGFLAKNDKDWLEALRKLEHSSKLRNEMGITGRNRVEKNFSLQITGPRIANLISKAAMSRKKRNIS